MQDDCANSTTAAPKQKHPAKTRKQKHHNKKTQWHYHKETSPEETTTDVKTLWKRFIIVIFHSLPSQFILPFHPFFFALTHSFLSSFLPRLIGSSLHTFIRSISTWKETSLYNLWQQIFECTKTNKNAMKRWLHQMDVCNVTANIDSSASFWRQTTRNFHETCRGDIAGSVGTFKVNQTSKRKVERFEKFEKKTRKNLGLISFSFFSLSGLVWPRLEHLLVSHPARAAIGQLTDSLFKS